MAVGEIVKAQSQEIAPLPDKHHLFNPERRKKIMEALKPKEGDPTGSFISDVARHAGIAPKTLKGWLAHGEMFPNGKFGRFNREVSQLIAQANDTIRKDLYATAKTKGRWEGIARVGEQFDPETWSRPSEKSTTTVNVNIVDKLQQVHVANGNSLTTGD